jgi:fimbrial chaperone protein
MRLFRGTALAAFSMLTVCDMSWAASLQVTPVMIEVAAPGAATTVKLRNDGATPLNAQIRVFRWTQVNGEDKLEPTNDVVASPPIAKLAPKVDYTVRLVRMNKSPVSNEETYRLLVDELPDAANQRNRAVNLLLRYSIPVFFYPAAGRPPTLTWSVEHSAGKLAVVAKNSGDRHLRISNLKLRDDKGGSISFGEGLTGYVLGGSTRRWVVASGKGTLNAGSPITVSAQGEKGPINDSAQPAR